MENDNKSHWDNAKYFLIIFLLLLLAASIGYGTGIRNSNDYYEKRLQQTKLVYIHPYGCGELCANMSSDAQQIAEAAGLEMQYVVLAANLGVPGVFIMNRTEMTMLYPFESREQLEEIMCEDFLYSQFCSPE